MLGQIEAHESRLKSVKTENERVDILNELSYLLKRVNMERSINCAEEAYNISIRLQEPKLIAGSLLSLGLAYILRGEIDKAIQQFEISEGYFNAFDDPLSMGRLHYLWGYCLYFKARHEESITHLERSLSFREAIGDDNGIAETIQIMASVQSERGYFPEALVNLFKAYNIADQKGDVETQARSNYMIGATFAYLFEYEKALNYLLQGLKLAEDISSHILLRAILFELAMLHYETGDYQQALHYGNRNLEGYGNIPSEKIDSESLTLIGEIHCTLGDLEKAEEFLEQAIAVTTETENPVGRVVATLGMGHLLIQKEDYVGAIQQFKDSLALAEKTGSWRHIYLIHEELSNALMNIGEIELAFSHYRSYHKLREEVMDRAVNAKRRYAEIEFDLERKEKERQLAILEREQANQHAREMQESLQNAQMLNEMTRQMSSTLDQSTLLKIVLTHTIELIDADSGCIALIPEQISSMEICELLNIPVEMREVIIQKGKSLNQQVLNGQRVVLIKDYSVFGNPVKELLEIGVASILGIPILSGDESLGSMLIFSMDEKKKFDERDQVLVEAIGRQTGVLLTNIRLVDELKHLALIDSMTGLFNRHHFFEMAQAEYERVNRYNSMLAVIMLDIDFFKQFNDTYGHLIGDEILRSVAHLCKKVLRKVDIIGRYGGEEFMILLPETTLKAAVDTARRLCKTIRDTPFDTKKGALSVTVSLGVTTVSANTYDSVADMLDLADQALYMAKETGRSRVCFWKDETVETVLLD